MDRIIVLAVALILVLPLGVGAQSTPGEAAEDVADAVNGTETAVMAVDDATKIMDVTWENGGATITFQSDIPRRATLTDVNSISTSGASSVNYKQVALATGRTEIFMKATSDQGSRTILAVVGDSAVSVSNPTQPLLESVTTGHFYGGVVLSGLTVLGLFVIGRWRHRRKNSGIAEVGQ